MSEKQKKKRGIPARMNLIEEEQTALRKLVEGLSIDVNDDVKRLEVRVGELDPKVHETRRRLITLEVRSLEKVRSSDE